jgi:hypothetical protein
MLTVVPVTLKQVNAFLARHHRTHKRVVGFKAAFGLTAEPGGPLVAVCCVARPRSRQLQRKHPLMAEVTRCCTDGTFDAASKCYANAWVVARAIGYRTLITYTLPEEGGPCLRALRQQGWRRVENELHQPLLFGGGTWHREGRPREDAHPTDPKWRWEVTLDPDKR